MPVLLYSSSPLAPFVKTEQQAVSPSPAIRGEAVLTNLTTAHLYA